MSGTEQVHRPGVKEDKVNTTEQVEDKFLKEPIFLFFTTAKVRCFAHKKNILWNVALSKPSVF